MTTPRASIVVLCFNGLAETTRPCVESLLRNTTGDYELILVDNASRDGTPEYLRNIAARHPQVRIQLNETNKGYAGGNNDGMRLARGEFIVLLNNDTLVPPLWLERLLAPFSGDARIGLVGPITNSCGNEQRIALPGLTEETFEQLASGYTGRHAQALFETRRLGFFCVALRREVPERIGLLDERFGIGMFEDDDYCLRARAAGYTLAVTEGCFVYHKGSVSFGRLRGADYAALFDRNRAQLNAKHGIEWSLTDIARAYQERFRRDLDAAFADCASPALERLMVRQEHFAGLLADIEALETNAYAASVRPATPWQRRFRRLRNELLRGTPDDRRRFARAALAWLLRRLSGRRCADGGSR